ncbi:MAG: acetate kinase [bacterium]
MAKIIAVNAGSSSIKFQLLEMPAETVISSGIMERIGLDEGIFTINFNDTKETTTPVLKDHAVGVELLLKTLVEKNIVSSLDEITGVGHRVVQGGEYFKDSVIITEDVIEKIQGLADLAPLHNPAHIVGIRAFQKALPAVTQVAVFDTVFHQTMPEEVYMYATPYSWYEDYGIRKYGAHGTSHSFVSKRAIELMKKKTDGSKIIVCHLGNGASLCAIKDGKCIDTSMGLTPLEGIPMGTRTGSLDPTVLELVARKENRSIGDVLNDFNKKSGYLGISGVGSDARDVTTAMLEGNHRAKLTFDIQAKRICDYIGSYYVLMGGLDAICFTAGMGENVIHLRSNICNRLEVLGVKLDESANANRAQEIKISDAKSKVNVYVIPTNEEVMIARDVVRLQTVNQA